MPLHSTTRRTPAGSTVSSPMHRPERARREVRHAADAAALSRSIDLGVNTTSGRVRRECACQRSRWKYDAGVDGMRDRHVVLRAHLQEALDACRGVVRTLALVAVRQQQRDAGALAPLLLAGGDELVDDRLRAVGEVAELGLPEHERVGARHRVAVLEAHRGVLRQQRVVDVELAVLAVVAALQRRVLPPVTRSTMTACRWPNVPRRESWPASRTARPSMQQRAERERLAHGPVDRAVLHDHLRPALQLRREPRVDGEALRQLDAGSHDRA